MQSHPEPLERIKAAIAGRYRIERELGRGGMATVYLAEDLKLRRKVAVKILDPELAATLGAERFLREIDLAARLDHPHVLTVIDSGEAQGALYYVMSYVEGGSLRDRLARERQLELDESLHIAGDVAKALDYAHGRGLIHRDVKPDNVLLGPSHAFLSDFGVARALSAAGGERLTETGVAIGTVEYMSPEQATGRTDLDGRSDVYSLACVLQEMLAGEPPFTGPSRQAIIARHASERPPSVRVVRPEVPVAVEDAIRKALAKAPADRFRTAGAFIEALTRGSAEARGMRKWRQVALAAIMSLIVTTAVVLGVLKTRNSVDFGERDWVLVADFEGPHDEPELAVVFRDLVLAGLGQSRYVTTVPRDLIQRAMRDAGIPETTRVDVNLARELAYRSSVRVILFGSIRSIGRDLYSLVLHVVDGEDGSDVLSRTTSSTGDGEELISKVEHLVSEVRAGLGERRSEIARNRPLVQVATPSLEAYRKMVDAVTLAGAGNLSGSNTLLFEALRLDTGFAAAWAMLGMNYATLRVPDSARRALQQALERPDRLSDAQRFRLAADVAYSIYYDLAAAIGWYDLYLHEAPNSVPGHNNRGLYLSSMGLHQEALREFETAITIDPLNQGPRQIELLNLVAELVVLGQIDSARPLSVTLETPFSKYADLLFPAAQNSWVELERVATAHADDPSAPGYVTIFARTALSSAYAARGAITDAETALDTAARVAAGSAYRWYRWAQLLLLMACSREVPRIPDELARDTTPAGEVLRGVWMARRGEVLGATAALQAARARDSVARKRLGHSLEYLEASIAATEGDWRRVIDVLGRAAMIGEHDALSLDRVGSLSMRWLVAQAYQEIGALDSAIVLMDLLLRPALIPPSNYALRGLPFLSAHRMLATLRERAGDTAGALRHWNALAMACDKPDRDVEEWCAQAASKQPSRAE